MREDSVVDEWYEKLVVLIDNVNSLNMGSKFPPSVMQSIRHGIITHVQPRVRNNVKKVVTEDYEDECLYCFYADSMDDLNEMIQDQESLCNASEFNGLVDGKVCYDVTKEYIKLKNILESLNIY